MSSSDTNANSSLYHAAGDCDLARVREALENGADPNVDRGTPVLIRPMLRASSSDKPKRDEIAQILGELLRAGADPNVVWEDGSALMHAVASGAIEVVEVMLEHGADPRFRNSAGHSAHHWCREASVRKLLSEQPPPPELSLEEVLQIYKSFRQPEDDFVSQRSEPLEIVKSCQNCAFLDLVSMACASHDALEQIGTVTMTRDEAEHMFCSRWQDEALVRLIRMGTHPGAVSWRRRHPILIEDDEKRLGWKSFLRKSASAAPAEDHDVTYDIRDLQTITWGGYDEYLDTNVINALVLDPNRNVVRLDLFEQEEVEIELQDGFDGIRVLQGELLPQPVDQHGDGQWMRQRAFVSGQERHEIIYQVIVSDRDQERLRDAGLGDGVDITLKRKEGGLVWYDSESMLVVFVTQAEIQKSPIGRA